MYIKSCAVPSKVPFLLWMTDEYRVSSWVLLLGDSPPELNKVVGLSSGLLALFGLGRNTLPGSVKETVFEGDDTSPSPSESSVLDWP